MLNNTANLDASDLMQGPKDQLIANHEHDESTKESDSADSEHKLTAFGGALAIISTILGGGIVGLPYAIYLLGLPLGFVLNLVVDYISYESGMMYMALRSLMPG